MALVFSVKGYAMNSEKKNPLFSFLNLLGQLILLSILWTICSLPVITVGASTAALYYTVVKVLRRNQDSLFAAFFREFRSNFLQSLNINMVFLCYFGILAYFAIPYLTAAQSGVDIGFYALVGLAILGALPLSFVYPAISRFYHKGGALVRFLLMVIGKHLHIVLSWTLLLAAGIAVIDALPVFGTGTVLLPWCAVCLLLGQVPRAIALAATYGIISMVRSFTEPKVMARQANLPPLAALCAMYIGFCTMGVGGMLLFPLALLLVKQLHESGCIRLWK